MCSVGIGIKLDTLHPVLTMQEPLSFFTYSVEWLPKSYVFFYNYTLNEMFCK